MTLRFSPRARAWNPSAVELAGAALWVGLVPLTLLMRPYAGLAQDARIYLGRGVADRDLVGVGQDTVFLHDGQNGFSVMARAVDALLGVMTPDAASTLLVAAGLATWLGAAAALALGLARGRVAWAVVVALLTLPSVYGGFGTFGYAEAVATPRIFAEAAVLAGLASLLAGRSFLALAFMLAGAAIHPLMALPGIAVAAVMLIHADRRWLLPVAAGGMALLVAALLGAPIVGKLVVPFDPAWAAVLRQRSVNLFPTLWSAGTFVAIARRLAAALLAASLLTGRPRVLVYAGCAVAVGGLGLAALLGDAWMLELVTQIQPWRSLWLLAVLGNAGFVIAAARLWRGGDLDRLTLAALAVSWLATDLAALQVIAVATSLALRAASLSGFALRLPRRALAAVAVLVASYALFDLVQSGIVASLLVAAARAQGGDATWQLVVSAEVPTVPLVAGALALACVPEDRLRRFAAARPRLVAWTCPAALAAAGLLGLGAWDETSAERGAARHPEAVASLRRAIGPAPGEVMWIDEDAENWFLAGRPAFFDTVQGAPILFSRALALDWADRAAVARSLGWAREIDVSPWTAPQRRLDPIALRPDAVERFCRDPRRPAAVVAPGEQLGAAPPGWVAAIWRPAEPFRRMWIDDGAIRWTDWDAFTVIRCPGSLAQGSARSEDPRPLGSLRSD